MTMAAFKYAHANQIEQNIKTLFKRLKIVTKMQITHEDFLSLFVPSEHRQMYRDIGAVAKTGDRRVAHITWGGADLTFQLFDRPESPYPPLAPRDLVVQSDAPPELIAKIDHWMRSGVGDASGEMGRVDALFNKLNDLLTKGQMRFVWPSIIALCNVTPVLSDVASELQSCRVPTNPPNLPHGLLLACRKTAETIAMAGLIPADVQESCELQGTIEMANGCSYDELDLGRFDGLST